jgi:hypothetical protein
MKNPFAIVSAILFTTFSTSVLGELLHSKVALSFPTFIGLYTAAMVLSLALLDYSGKRRSYVALRQKHLGLTPSRCELLSMPPGATWVYRTVS